MSKVNVIRAWKDAGYRTSLSTEELSALPENPAGEVTRLEVGSDAHDSSILCPTWLC